MTGDARADELNAEPGVRPKGGLTEAAADTLVVRQIQGFHGWLGAGRKLTQTGQLKLADAKELVKLLETGDEVDRVIGGQLFRTKSSQELSVLRLIFDWARAARLVRTVHGRLVPVKKSARLLEKPLDLWMALLQVFPRMGEELLSTRWGGVSLLGDVFPDAVPAALTRLYDTQASVVELAAMAWEMVRERWRVDELPEDRREVQFGMVERDLMRAMKAMQALGAVAITDSGVALTELGRYGMARMQDEAMPGDRLFEVRVTLLEVQDPDVWRRLIVPAGIHLDRLHDVLQAAMGWRDYHLHSFTDGHATYSQPQEEEELDYLEEHPIRLSDLVGVGSHLVYTYDYGDDWRHELVVERELTAGDDDGTPTCIEGGGACPPEDSGGPPGYADVCRVLADPEDDEFDSIVRWMGLEEGARFDPGRFRPDEINEELRRHRPRWRYDLVG